MRIRVSDTTLFVDVEGLQLVPDGPRMRPRPSVILLHGGPGMDHSVFKPAFSALTDVAQVFYVDLRGHGRSDPCPPEQWTLAQWGDDVRELCDVLGIVRPVVLGVSFGGFVALAYAVRHCGHPGGLILSNTRAHTDLDSIGAAFGRLGGPEAAARARDFWGSPTAETLSGYMQTCAPLYMGIVSDPARAARMRATLDLMIDWCAREHPRYNLLPRLRDVRCPTLVLAAEEDPICPIEDVEKMVAALPAALVTYRRFPNVRHDLTRGLGETFLAMVREFIGALAAPSGLG